MVVTDPDGNANEIQLRKVRQRAPAARDDFWGFGPPRKAAASRREPARARAEAAAAAAEQAVAARHVQLAVPLMPIR